MGTSNRVLVDLTVDEYQSLFLALGFATGAARLSKDKDLFASFVRLTNAVGRSTPGRFVPFEVEAVEALSPGKFLDKLSAILESTDVT